MTYTVIFHVSVLYCVTTENFSRDDVGSDEKRATGYARTNERRWKNDEHEVVRSIDRR